jgi:hypothetical protein
MVGAVIPTKIKGTERAGPAGCGMAGMIWIKDKGTSRLQVFRRDRA